MGCLLLFPFVKKRIIGFSGSLYCKGSGKLLCFVLLCGGKSSCAQTLLLTALKDHSIHKSGPYEVTSLEHLGRAPDNL